MNEVTVRVARHHVESTLRTVKGLVEEEDAEMLLALTPGPFDRALTEILNQQSRSFRQHHILVNQKGVYFFWFGSQKERGKTEYARNMHVPWAESREAICEIFDWMLFLPGWDADEREIEEWLAQCPHNPIRLPELERFAYTEF